MYWYPRPACNNVRPFDVRLASTRNCTPATNDSVAPLPSVHDEHADDESAISADEDAEQPEAPPVNVVQESTLQDDYDGDRDSQTSPDEDEVRDRITSITFSVLQGHSFLKSLKLLRPSSEHMLAI